MFFYYNLVFVVEFYKLCNRIQFGVVLECVLYFKL